MSYIGKTPTIGNFQICDAISVVNNQAAYTMQVGSVNVSPESANHMIVSLNGVIQKPTDAYTVSGSTITFASNLVTGDVINFIQILGNVLDLGVPSDNTVTLAKLASGTDGNLISYDTSGNPVAVATGNDGQVLTSAGAGAVPTFETLPVGGITEIDNWRITSDTTSNGYITSNWERNDSADFAKLGTGMTQSSGVFTFPSTGKYLIELHGDFKSNADAAFSFNLHTTVNNSTYTFRVSAGNASSSTNEYSTSDAFYVVNVDNVSNVKVKFETSGFNGNPILRGNSDQNETNVLFIKLV